ncbi:MAG TPA: AAA family ATPase [Methylocella sp.]|jgi:hypothetical protein|nr:AAA family ATPase [Methylocella sp.]
MNFIHYGRDPDPKTVDVRMTALAAEGFTAASFGLSEHQLRHHLDPCHEPELFELWKMDQAGRIRLWEWLSAAHKATMPRPNRHAAEAKTPRQGVDPAQISGAIQRGLAADFKRGGTTVMQDADTLEMETIEWLWLHWLALGKLHLIAGAPEAGKTTIALSLAATISSGSHWPDGTRAPVGNVLIWGIMHLTSTILESIL